MWIKICGNTNLEDARLAVEAGADALGFVFAPSPRQVSIGQARRIIAELPPEIEKYGVFVDADFAQIAATVNAAGLTGVQLHRSGDPGLTSRLKENYAGSTKALKILSVLHLGAKGLGAKGLGAKGDRPGIPSHTQNSIADSIADSIAGEALDRALAQASGDAAIDAVLVDSSTAAAVGGTGAAFDWAAAQASFARAAARVRVVVAGGLRPENVKLAISTLRPWGVDVVSGVEAAPGKKDPARLLAFIQAAREAEALL